jgi:hypothetical protein
VESLKGTGVDEAVDARDFNDFNDFNNFNNFNNLDNFDNFNKLFWTSAQPFAASDIYDLIKGHNLRARRELMGQ